jgi:hypothetical protein
VKNTGEVPEPFAQIHGVIIGPLQARLPDRITIGETVVFLTGSTKCDHPLGTALRVAYTEHEGLKEAHHLARAEW